MVMTLSPDIEPAPPADNLIQPFQIERHGLRGRLVRLGSVVDQVLKSHGYPTPVAVMLGETLALAATLGGALKFDGVFTLQTKGDGPVGLMVADMTSEGQLRGYAQYDPGRLKEAMSSAPESGIGNSVPQLLGAGHLAFTVDQGPDTDQTQGIVELNGATLAECIHHYFRQSEQIDAAIKVAIDHEPYQGGEKSWRAGAMMIERLPEHRSRLESSASGKDFDDGDDGWREAVVLMGSATAAELTDHNLKPHKLLYRLFHDPGVRVYRPVALDAGCRCSRQRVANMLRAFPEDEIKDLMIDGEVIVTCEFCGTRHGFNIERINELYAN